ncbi:unnamed protein product [Arctia plantaginis]|uniref:Uncharacterized protein n=1 Tax=Arctia plantaginis TaxID=874455 RepID=A0A8S1A2X2_ARCPL|nr:unnamed protein product [Arctia plantaginis]
MRALTTTVLFIIVTVLYFTAAAPTNSNLQTGRTIPTNDAEGKPYIEEVVVESVLQVRSPSKFNRQYRTNTHSSLQDGARVEARQYH